MIYLAALACVAPAPNPLADLVQVGILVVAAVALFWAVREWVWGGSILKVQLELGRTDGLRMVRASPADMENPDAIDWRMPYRLDGPALDVAVITVINKGRTPVTVLSPALLFSSKGAEDLRVSGQLVGGSWGEDESRIRLEVHDSCVFTLMLQPMAVIARSDMTFQKPQGAGGNIWARAAVTSGKGGVKLSPSSVRSRAKWYSLNRLDARWKVSTPLRGKPLTPTEELMAQFLAPGGDVYDQSVLLGSVLGAAEAGESVNELAARVEDRYGIMNAGKIAMRAMVLAGKL
ncbi:MULTISPECIES: hypothetical protein [unclassified Microbacterium]|uniref:hypothetical protein n=1 Tax=unclassified Microbacterium TaxID=2609290 RepID=UPI001DB81DA3|nr:MULTISPECIES: hypothetical protein [unclassified Microbacterium]EED6225573.1 hypothetical protein [Salmonella enterica subsp. enterica serovar Haifa]MCT1364724.1 hypothetical protein [Microbacterium sp. p3-SID131]MCT1377310.1 hypothetical protein [Microbacterium sp. p3-SID337]